MALVVSSCTGGRIDMFTCKDPCLSCKDPCGECLGGTCLPPVPVGWDGPLFVWKGPNGEAPECPDDAPMNLYEGYAGLNTYNACGTCECSPTTCELPETIEVSTNNATCGGTLQSVDVPADWDGSCLAIDPIASPTSIRVGTTRRGGCEPVVTQVPRAVFDWKLMARGCSSLEPIEPCEGKTTVCLPGNLAYQAGFEACVVKSGDEVLCPEGYPELSQFYGGIRDTTLCTQCSCRKEQDSTCDATVRVYDDASCTAGGFDLPADLEQAACTPVVSSSPHLTSLEASFKSDEPGSCTPEGGQLQGAATLQDPVTLCCRPIE